MCEVVLKLIKGDIPIQGIADHHEDERVIQLWSCLKSTIPPPTVASIFQGGVEDLSSSCPTSQEPAVSVPYLFQTAGANLPLGGSPQASPPQSTIAGQSGPPRDPRSQSERRRVSIQTPPTPDGVPEGQDTCTFRGKTATSQIN